MKKYIKIINNKERLNINIKKIDFLKLIQEETQILQKKIGVFIEENKAVKPSILIFLHIVGALIVAYIGTMVFLYVGVMSEVGSFGIFHLWQRSISLFIPVFIVFLSFFVVLLSNPISALIFLILVFFGTALFLLSMNVNFLALIYLIIYIGAIAILFLFIIMLFNLRELHTPTPDQNPEYTFFSMIGYFFFLISAKFSSLIFEKIFIFIEYDKYFNDFVNRDFDSLQYFLTYQNLDTLLFGTLLYEYYSFLFLVGGMLLLTSMLGSIILALSTTEKAILSTNKHSILHY